MQTDNYRRLGNHPLTVSPAEHETDTPSVILSLAAGDPHRIVMTPTAATQLAEDLIAEVNRSSPRKLPLTAAAQPNAGARDLRNVSLNRLFAALPGMVWRTVRWRTGQFVRTVRLNYHNLRRPQVEIGGIRIPVGPHLSDNLREALLLGYYEAAELRTVAGKLSSDDRVMELGTGIGLMSSFCAKRIGSERVFTFEANPTLEPRIREVYALNGVQPELQICLLGRQAGEQPFYIERDFWASSVIRHGRNARAVTMPVKSFNDEIRRIDPTFLIVDIEGGEYELFRYCDLHKIRKIALELHTSILGQQKIEAVKGFMAAQGFVIDERLSSRIAAHKEELFLERA